MAASIPISVRHCLDQFKGLQTVNDFERSDSNEYNIKNELDRFKIWVGNLAAHRPVGKRSLEYRLRDAEDLRSSVLELLSNLSNALDRYTLPEPGEESPDSDDDDELGFEYDELATQPPNALRDIHDTINLLYQFSATLRNPARQNRLKEGLMSMRPYYSEVYIKLVQDKFADAPQYLSERIGGAISSRRQYFKYREDHKISMSAGLDDVIEGRSTVASSIPKAVEYVHDIEETESTYSMTSYAPTESETSNLRPPALPEAGRNGNPFECPICYSIVQITGETSWKRHFFEDLAPYICTRANCRLGNKMYSRRRDWQRHETHMHDRIWICPFGCGAEYRSAEDLNPHLVKTHGHSNEGGRSTRMAHGLSRPTDIPFDLKCPLCKKVTASTTLWFKHVARHMEQLALQAVDSHKLATDSDDEDLDASDHVSEDVARSQGSSNRDDEPEPDDPAEPKYCYCNRGSYGDMIACDNESCPREWFHLGCTELQKLPGEQETWYCRGCHPSFGQQFDGKGKADAQLSKEQIQTMVQDDQAGDNKHNRREELAVVHGQTAEDMADRDADMKVKERAAYRPFQQGEQANQGTEHYEYQEPHRERKDTEIDTIPTKPGYQRISIACAHCRRRRIRCLIAEGDPENRCQNCIRLKKECIFYPVDQQAAIDARSAATEARESSGAKEMLQSRLEQSEYDPDGRLKSETTASGSAIGLDRSRSQGHITSPPVKLYGPGFPGEEGSSNSVLTPDFNRGRTDRGIVENESLEEVAQTREDRGEDGNINFRKKEQVEPDERPQLWGEIVQHSRAPRAPVWPKIRREFIEIDTLKYYDLPWKYDSNDPDYVIIMRDMDKRETDFLLKHTSHLRSGKLLLEPTKKGDRQFSQYRKRSKSRSRRPDEPETLRRG